MFSAQIKIVKELKVIAHIQVWQCNLGEVCFILTLYVECGYYLMRVNYGSRSVWVFCSKEQRISKFAAPQRRQQIALIKKIDLCAMVGRSSQHQRR